MQLPATSSVGGTVTKSSNNASPTVNNGSTRPTNGDVNASATGKSKKPAPPAIDPSEVHEMVQNRIAALEGEKVQGGEEDKRSGMSLGVG